MIGIIVGHKNPLKNTMQPSVAKSCLSKVLILSQ